MTLRWSQLDCSVLRNMRVLSLLLMAAGALCGLVALVLICTGGARQAGPRAARAQGQGELHAPLLVVVNPLAGGGHFSHV